MQDDPFARAVARTKAAEQAEAAERRDRVTKHVRSGAQTALRIHATVYAMVNLLLIVIWATTSMATPWFLYVLLGWGIGLVAHWSATHSLTRRREARSFDPGPAYASAALTSKPKVAAQPAGSPVSPSASTSDELSKLAKLHKSGVLSDEEFSAAKAKLLQ